MIATKLEIDDIWDDFFGRGWFKMRRVQNGRMLFEASFLERVANSVLFNRV